MKIVLCHPGADWSVYDIYQGLLPALKRRDVQVIEYNLSGRLQYSAGWLAWCWKHNKKQGPKPGMADSIYLATTGILERALRHEVDWVLFISAMHIHHEALTLLRRAGLRTAILFTESPNDDQWQIEAAKLVSLCWVNERTSVSRFREVQPRTYYWQHAIDLERHRPRPDGDGLESVPAHDVVFVGTFWEERVKLLQAIDWDDIDLGLYGATDLIGSRSKLRQYVRGGITANHMAAALYRRAKVGLNLHRTSVGFGRKVLHVQGAESLNPRCYELAATGCFLLSDWRAEMDEVFHGLVPTFKTPEELQELLRRYLSDAPRRKRITDALPGCVAGHTFDNRVGEMLKILEV